MLIPLEWSSDYDLPIFLALYIAGFLLAASIRLWYTQGGRRCDQRGALETGIRYLAHLPACPEMFILPGIYILTVPCPGRLYPPGIGRFGRNGIFGAALLLWRSHADLGANFTPNADVQQGSAGRFTGVYQHIRHPMYASQFSLVDCPAVPPLELSPGLASHHLHSPLCCPGPRRGEDACRKSVQHVAVTWNGRDGLSPGSADREHAELPGVLQRANNFFKSILFFPGIFLPLKSNIFQSFHKY